MVDVIPEHDIDRIDALGCPIIICSIGTTEQQGVLLNWPGWPLVVTKELSGLVVNAEVGRAGDWDDDDGDLAEELNIPLGSTELVYRESDECAWLREFEGTDLREACRRVAALAPKVSRALAAELYFGTDHITWDELDLEGPWVWN